MIKHCLNKLWLNCLWPYTIFREQQYDNKTKNQEKKKTWPQNAANPSCLLMPLDYISLHYLELIETKKIATEQRHEIQIYISKNSSSLHCCITDLPLQMQTLKWTDWATLDRFQYKYTFALLSSRWTSAMWKLKAEIDCTSLAECQISSAGARSSLSQRRRVDFTDSQEIF